MPIPTKEQIEKRVDMYKNDYKCPPTYDLLAKEYGCAVSTVWKRCVLFRDKMDRPVIPPRKKRDKDEDDVKPAIDAKKGPYKCYMLAPGLYSLTIRNKIKGLYVEDLFDTVCEFYNRKRVDVSGRSRYRELVNARQQFAFFARKYTHAGLREIARISGGNYSTAIHSVKTVQSLIDTDPSYKSGVNALNAFICNKHEK